MEKPVQAQSRLREANPPGLGEALRVSKFKVEKFLNLHCQEKPLLFVRYPYRKPTQVDEERILRPAEEALLRNSAKLPRNFGRRGAIEIWSQRNGPSNCLTKTQVCAKP